MTTTALTNTAGHRRETAAQAYTIRQANVTELLSRLQAAIEAHGARAAARPGDWGLPGDLARIEGALAEALAVLGDESGVRELGIDR
jgi:hypothetical protein